MNKRKSRKSAATVLGSALLMAGLLAGCSGNPLQEVPDPKAEPTGDQTVLSLELEGSVQVVGSNISGASQSVKVGDKVVYTYSVTSKAKTTLKNVGVVTTLGQFWCKTDDGKAQGLQVDLAPGQKLLCFNESLPEEAKEKKAVDVHTVTEKDVAGPTFDVVAKAYGYQPSGDDKKANPERQSQSVPIALKLKTGK